MFPHEPDDASAGIPLQAHVAELNRRCAAAARLQGGSTYYAEEIVIFRDYVAEKALSLAKFPEGTAGPPSDEGNEHQVWFQPSTASFIKITLPDFFGLRVLYAPDEDERASPIRYLERWHLHNELFGDSVTFCGALTEEGALRLVIQQPAIEGKPATLDQINDFFTRNGWLRFQVGDDIAYFDPERKVVISDTHRGNLILMSDGLLAPIDLRVQPITGALLDYVATACGLNPPN